MRVTDEVEAIGEPAGDVGRTVVDDRQAHAGQRAHEAVLLDIAVAELGGGGGRDVVGRHVEQRRDAKLNETRTARGVPTASQVQPRQQLDRIAALYTSKHQHNRCVNITQKLTNTKLKVAIKAPPQLFRSKLLDA